MRIGPLYEQAVDLSPRAARMAAALLVKEANLPEPLRRSLTMALRGGEAPSNGVDDTRLLSEDAIGCSDAERRAATRFVEACKAVCERG
jgi:hypothetical protein